jgi:hypothetical protein
MPPLELLLLPRLAAAAAVGGSGQAQGFRPLVDDHNGASCRGALAAGVEAGAAAATALWARSLKACRTQGSLGQRVSSPRPWHGGCCQGGAGSQVCSSGRTQSSASCSLQHNHKANTYLGRVHRKHGPCGLTGQQVQCVSCKPAGNPCPYPWRAGTRSRQAHMQRLSFLRLCLS